MLFFSDGYYAPRLWYRGSVCSFGLSELCSESGDYSLYAVYLELGIA